MANRPTYEQLQKRIKTLEKKALKHIQEEKKLKRSEMEKETVLNSISELVVYQDMEMKVVWANRAAGESVGMSPEQLEGRYCYEIWQQRDKPCDNCPVLKARKEGGAASCEMTSPDGRVWMVLGNPVLNEKGHVIGVVEITHDITKGKKVEADLLAANERLNYFLSSTPAVIYTAKPSGDYGATFISDNITSVMGYEPQEFIEGPSFWIDHIHPEDLSQVLKEIPKVFDRGFHGYEYRFKRKNGKYIWVRDEMKLVRNKQGEPIEITGLWLDISDRKRAESERADSEYRLQELFEHMSSGVMVYSAKDKGDDFIIKKVNKAAERIGRVKRKDVMDRSVLEVFPGVESENFDLFNIFKRVWRTGRPEYLSPSFYMDKLRTLWIDNYVYKLPSGEIVAVFNDVTEHKRAEKILRESEARTRAILNAIPDLMFQVNSDGIFFDYKGPSEELYVEPEAFLGKRIHDVLPRELADLAMKNVKRALETGEVQVFEYQLLIRDQMHDFEARLVKSQEQEVLIVIRNISSQKQIEGELRRARQEWEDIFQAIGHPTLILDHKHRLIQANRTAALAAGKSPQELVGKKCYEVFHGRGSPPENCPMEKMLESKGLETEAMEMEALGGIFLVSCTPVYNENHELQKVIHIATDITEQRQAEDALRESEHFIRTVISSIDEGVIVYDRDLRYKMWNRFMEEMIGIPEADLLGKFALERFPHLTEQGVDILLKRALKGETVRSPDMPYHIHKTDKRGWTVNLYSPHINPDGDIIGVVTTIRDITEHKEADKAMKLKDSAMAASIDAIAIGDFGGKLTYVNPAFLEMWGYGDEKEVIGRPAVEFWRTKGEAMNVLDSLNNEGNWVGELVAKRKDGSFFNVQVSANMVSDEEDRPTHMMASFVDITEKKRMESLLQQAQKMEAIGTLAGGIAHDFNNILAAIIGYSELAAHNLPDKSIARENLNEVLKAGNRAKDLVKQILTFSRKGETEFKAKSIIPIIEEALKLLRASLPTTIDIQQDINVSSEYGTVAVDPTQIHQLLINLCTNASHAMQERGGILKINLTGVELGENDVADFPEMVSGRYLYLKISDTGKGMTPEVMERIFDPYFTTKEKDVGTGMGLAVVHGIIRNHGGGIRVESELAKGSVFHVYLPVTESEEKIEKEKADAVHTGKEHILFIDDEQALANLGKQMLESLGYDVVATTDVMEAIELFEKDPKRFDLVITDTTMPHMRGDELAEELMRIRSDIPIIICTGYSDHVSEERARDLGIKGFAMKPYVMQDLAQMVRGVLE